MIEIKDIIGGCLIFLLGAIVFQKSKSVKTFIAIIVITTVLGMIVTPVIKRKILGLKPEDLIVSQPVSGETL